MLTHGRCLVWCILLFNVLADNFDWSTTTTTRKIARRPQCITHNCPLSLARADGQAYIISYKDQAQLQISYKGMLALLWRTGLFTHIKASAVYANDSDDTARRRLFGILPPIQQT